MNNEILLLLRHFLGNDHDLYDVLLKSGRYFLNTSILILCVNFFFQNVREQNQFEKVELIMYGALMTHEIRVKVGFVKNL